MIKVDDTTWATQCFYQEWSSINLSNWIQKAPYIPYYDFHQLLWVNTLSLWVRCYSAFVYTLKGRNRYRKVSNLHPLSRLSGRCVFLVLTKYEFPFLFVKFNYPTSWDFLLSWNCNGNGLTSDIKAITMIVILYTKFWFKYKNKI